MLRKTFVGMAAALALSAGTSSALAQGTAFTYQGQLKNSGAAVNSATDMQFSLWTAASGGSQIGSTITQTNVAVTQGLFTTPVDFGVNPYTSNQTLWLQIAVRNPAGTGSYVPMSSRQQLTPAPFSMATRGINVNSAGTATIGNAASAGLLQFARGGDGATNAGFLGWLSPADNTTFRLANLSGGGLLRLESNTATTFNRSFDGAEVMRITNGGKVGIGNAGPGSVLDVVGTGPTVAGTGPARVIRAQASPSVTFGTCISADATNLAGGKVWDFFSTGGAAGEGQGKLILRNNTDLVNALTITPNAMVAIGVNNVNPGSMLDVRLPNNNAGSAIQFGSQSYCMGRLGEDANTNTVVVANAFPTGTAPVSIDFRIGGTAPANTKARVRDDGVFEVKTLQINGGSDLVEGFDSQTKDIEPGTLMVIDPEHPGQLVPSSGAYDSRVAGIVSGAGGVNPGIKMGQDGVLDGEHLIAMTGRVYVKATTAGGPIQPGDLLTTSDIPGHAMKASDRDRAGGATVGKAMSALDKDTGLVLVLVNLQ